jgi:hypothetical protein
VHLLCISAESYLVAYSQDDFMLYTYTINGRFIKSACIDEHLNAMILSEDGKVVLTGGERCLVVLRWVHSLKLANSDTRRGLSAVIDGSSGVTGQGSGGGAATSGANSSSPGTVKSTNRPTEEGMSSSNTANSSSGTTSRPRTPTGFQVLNIFGPSNNNNNTNNSSGNSSGNSNNGASANAAGLPSGKRGGGSGSGGSGGGDVGPFIRSPIQSMILTKGERHLIVGLQSGHIQVLAQVMQHSNIVNKCIVIT